MKTITLRRRKQILADYDAGGVTRKKVAETHGISLGMVKKLLQQRRATDNIADRREFTGRPPIILEKHRQRMAELLNESPEMTLFQLKNKLRICCTLPAIHRVLKTMGLTYATRCPNSMHRLEQGSRRL